jgi:hypothetical protein
MVRARDGKRPTFPRESASFAEYDRAVPGNEEMVLEGGAGLLT